MAVTDRVPLVTASRRRSGWVAALLLVLVGVVLAAAGVVVVTDTAPQAGSTFGPDAVGLIATEEGEPTEAGEPRPVYVYRYEPGVTFLTMTSIRNDGPIALTLLGLVPPPADIESTALPWADRLLLSPWPDVVGPEDATPLDTAVIDAGQEVAVWIVWRVGTHCPAGEQPPLEAGSGYVLDAVDVRWSVMGIPQSGRIDLRHVIEVRNPTDDPLVTCPQ